MTTPDYRAELQALYDDVTAERWDAMAHRAAIKRTQTALAAPEAVDGICTGCDAPRHKAIAAVAKGGVACCPDCSTLTVADRNAIREAVAQRAALEAVGPTRDEEALIALERIERGELSGGADDYELVRHALLARPVAPEAVGVADDSDVIRALVKAEAALADIGDAEREPGDDLAWCERRAAEALPVVREALAFCSTAHAAPVPIPGDVEIGRWVESQQSWPDDWPMTTHCQLVSLIGEALEFFGAPTGPAPIPASERLAVVLDGELRRLRRLLGSLIDSLCLPGHGIIPDEWKKACLHSGRYCEPFLSGPPASIPASERLPGAGDMDSEGTCWCWHSVMHTWGLFRFDPTAHSHWLPHWSLPLPGAQP